MNMDDLYRLLRTGHAQAQGIVDTVSDPMLVLDQSLCVQNASRAFFDAFKVDRYETIGKHLYELGNGQWDIPALRLLLTDVIPKSTAVIDYEVEHEFPDLGRRTMLVTARTLFHPDNGAHTMLLSIVDATNRYRQDAAKDILFDELRHRMKNMLAMTQALARQTTTEGRSAQEYRDAFLGRFAAMVDAQEIGYTLQEGSGLEALIERVVTPYKHTPNAVLTEPGQPIVLGPRTIMSLGLVLHELATNAAKYGALSVNEGQVRIGWEVEEANGKLRLWWVESGGPTVTAPTAMGYGSKLIQSATTFSLGGHVEQEFRAGGLKTEIVIPLGDAPLPG